MLLPAEAVDKFPLSNWNSLWLPGWWAWETLLRVACYEQGSLDGLSFPKTSEFAVSDPRTWNGQSLAPKASFLLARCSSPCLYRILSKATYLIVIYATKEGQAFWGPWLDTQPITVRRVVTGMVQPMVAGVCGTICSHICGAELRPDRVRLWPSSQSLWPTTMSFTLRLRLPQFHKLRPKCSNCGGYFMLKPCKIFISLVPRRRSSLPAVINTSTPFYWPNSTFPPCISHFLLLPIPGVNLAGSCQR